jgi:integrase/recombinase XerC
MPKSLVWDDLSFGKGEKMDILDEFKTVLIEQDCAKLTVRGYVADLRLFRVWFEQTNGEAFCMEIITPSDLREYRQYLIGVERRKPATINRKLAAISRLMKWAMDTGWIDRNPLENIHLVSQEKPGPRYLDKKEQYALQRAIEKDLQVSRMRYPKRWLTRLRDASLVIFLLHTGLRLNEALTLELGDIQLAERKGQVLVRQGKGGRARTVPLNVDARKALQDWLAVRPGSGRHIWTQVEGESSDELSSRSVQRVLARIGQDAGLEHLTPHVCRHTFAKNLVDSGVGLEKVAALLGHSNLNTTRIYVTPNQKDLEQAVERLEAE